MNVTHGRIVVGGIAAGVMMNLVMLLTFRGLGFGWKGDGILLTSPAQSEKLVAVWTELEPLPLVAVAPAPIMIGLVLFGILHAYLFHWLSPSLPSGRVGAGLGFGGLVFVMTFLFWEFFTPFNMFGEPLHLIALELVFWACIALAEGLTIGLIIGRRTPMNGGGRH